MCDFFLKHTKTFTLLLLCVNCSYPVKTIDNEDSGVREIDIIANLSDNQPVKLSDIASGIEYCMLETDEKCLVVGINSIYCTKDDVVAVGGMSNPAFYVFERQSGNFVRQISKYGQGPGEYTEIINFFWDELSEQVSVFGHNQYKFYNLDGTLSHQANKFKHRMFRFVSHEDFYVGYVSNYLGDATARIAFYDKTGDLIDTIPNYRSWKKEQTWNTTTNDAWLYIFNKNLYFKELYCDTLYQIKDFALHPRYIFNTGERAVPYEIQEGGRYNTMDIFRNQGVVEDRYENYVCILKILEDNVHLYFTIEYKKQLYPAIYNKMKDKLQIMPPVTVPPQLLSRNAGQPRSFYGLENDLDGGLPFWPQQIISDKEMISVFTAEDLLTLDASKITDVKLKNILNQINEDSNPIVAIVTLKE
ncbi:6-bladed beta-propeller [Parabacteroides sp. OttesenSCG-928-G07]|nr:6-bladed beta-propeller [Parabacteroides sp. OttesenSCG-928-G21]MDL2278172.1 6-bladed beta-propeller [Parabacteroides sp. OttesenSCG-928-G07]